MSIWGDFIAYLSCLNCLKIILSENYVEYEAALEMCNLEKLSTRREKRQLNFALKCLEYPFTQNLFPENESKREKFVVNFARTEQYKNSTVPQCQRNLNKHFAEKH